MNITKKSKVTAVALAFLLGPLGVMYAHPLIGFILLVVTLVTAATFVVPVVLWLFGMLIAASAVDKHNQSVDEFIQVMKAR